MASKEISIQGIKALNEEALGRDVAKGRSNESRAHEILSKLATEGVFTRISRSSNKQNREGIDLFGHVIVGDCELKIPFQIKSSAQGAAEYRRTHEHEIAKKRIIILVVNDNKSDSDLERRVIQNLRMHFGIQISQHRAGMAEVVNAPV